MPTTTASTAPKTDSAEARCSVREDLQGAALRTDRTLGDLVHARCDPQAPDTRVGSGQVTLSFPHVSITRRATDEPTLNAAIPWTITIHGAVADMTADLTDMSLRSLTVEGDLSDGALDLANPKGTVAVQLGSVDSMAIRRPADAPVRIVLSENARHLTLDEQHLGSGGGPTALTTLDFHPAVDRIDIHLDNASTFTVTTP